jgi:hypothetical protein
MKGGLSPDRRSAAPAGSIPKTPGFPQTLARFSHTALPVRRRTKLGELRPCGRDVEKGTLAAHLRTIRAAPEFYFLFLCIEKSPGNDAVDLSNFDLRSYSKIK